MGSTAEAVIFFDMVLMILLSSYGFSSGLVSVNVLTSIGPPPFQPAPPGLPTAVINACGNILTYFTSILSATCIAYEIGKISGGGGNNTAGIAASVYSIGIAIYQIPALIVWGLNIVITFLNIMLLITFNPAFSANGVPALGFIWVGLQGYVVFEVIRIFRGSSSGV